MAIASIRATSVSFASLSSRRQIAAADPERRKLRKTPVIGDFSHFGEAVRRDFDFFKKRIRRGAEWANETFRLPQVAKTVDNFVWLRHLEDPGFSPSPLEHQKWPEPYYPELSGLDLIMADLKALEAYALYFYYLSRSWSKPLPEAYDPQEIANYFSCRPHIVALRLLEIFSSFASATIRIRAFGLRRSLSRGSNSGVDGSSQYNYGVVLKETMLNLGPTFIKVGQSLSTRPDIIGSEISKALSELHDQIPPFPTKAALKIIEEEFSSPVESLFSHISEEPVAAASFGQVYTGSTIDGLKVAVKVQRPNLRHVVVRDIYILRLGLGILQKIARRKSDLRLYADELGKGLVGELDYTLEAANASEFLEAHSQFSFMKVPKVLKDLTRKRVLTMEWMVGDSPNDLMSVATCSLSDHGSTYSERHIIEAKRRLLDMVRKGVEASLVQLLETGLLHADPHPGNLQYMPSGQIGFLDFGLLCRMERKHRYAMLASIVHIVNGDWSSLVQALSQMDVVRPGTNTRLVTLDLEEALGEVEFKDGIPDVKFSRVLGKIWSVALKYHFRMPPYYTLVLRSLASLEGLAVAADPNFKTFEAAYPFVVRKLLTENSASSREILYSVVLNKKKEFHWQRLALFLRIGATRKSLQLFAASGNETSVANLQDNVDGVSGISYLVLKLLPSKDGIMLRRLLMTVDAASLVRAVVSKEAKLFQHQICRIIANRLYQQALITLRLGGIVSQLGPSSRLSSSTYDVGYLVKDRRVKVIFLKVLNSMRREPLLMLRFFWSCCVIFIAASALACHRVLVTLSEVSLSRVAFASKRIAVSNT